MTDLFSKKKRSEIMSKVRGKDTSPELLIRKHLFSLGFRYRLHVSSLPGKPDLVFPKYRCVVFIHGCFWHGHSCKKTFPQENKKYWKQKINGNIKRDAKNIENLKEIGWRTIVIWECSISGKRKISLILLGKQISKLLKSSIKYKEIQPKGEV